jgi:methionyl-tRNA formyltransferase
MSLRIVGRNAFLPGFRLLHDPRPADRAARPGSSARKPAALNVTAPSAQLELDGSTYLITRTEPAGRNGSAAPDTLLEEHPDGWTIQTADEALRLTRPRGMQKAPAEAGAFRCRRG